MPRLKFRKLTSGRRAATSSDGSTFDDVLLDDFLTDLDDAELAQIQKRYKGIRMSFFGSEKFTGVVPRDARGIHELLTEQVMRIRAQTGCGSTEAFVRLRATEEGRALVQAWQRTIRPVD